MLSAAGWRALIRAQGPRLRRREGALSDLHRRRRARCACRLEHGAYAATCRWCGRRASGLLPRDDRGAVRGAGGRRGDPRHGQRRRRLPARRNPSGGAPLPQPRRRHSAAPDQVALTPRRPRRRWSAGRRSRTPPRRPIRAARSSVATRARRLAPEPLGPGRGRRRGAERDVGRRIRRRRSRPEAGLTPSPDREQRGENGAVRRTQAMTAIPVEARATVG